MLVCTTCGRESSAEALWCWHCGAPLITERGAVPAFGRLAATQGATWETRGGPPLVGREAELDLLGDAFERARQASRCELVSVLGASGVGKTRLADELTIALSDRATALVGSCRTYARGISFWPVAEVVGQAVGISPEDTLQVARSKLAERVPGDGVAERVCAVLGLGEVAFPLEEVFWGTRKLFEALAHRRPLVVVLDDTHRAEPALLDLLDYLTHALREAPVLVVCLAQAEPSPLPVEEDSAALTLGPLNESDANVLAEAFASALRLPSGADAIIAEASAGNPLYIEQAAWRFARDSLDEESLPPTLDALIAARIDGLGEVERAVLTRAALIGEDLPRSALGELVPPAVQPELDGRLKLLVEERLLRRGASPLFGGPRGFRFAHERVREIACERIPASARARLHQRLAAWLARAPGGPLGERDALVAHQLERAVVCGHEAGTVDEAGTTLAPNALRRLTAAGRRAYARGDMAAAASMLERAGALPGDIPLEPQALFELGLALSEIGDLRRADLALGEAAGAARATGDLRLELNSLLERSDLRTSVSPDDGAAELGRVAERAIPVLWELGDELGLARAWRNLSDAHCFACCYGAAAESLSRALVHAERAGDERVQSQILAELSMTLIHGPCSVEEGIDRLGKLLEGLTEARTLGRANGFVGFTTRAQVEAFGLARLEAMRGRFDRARLLCGRARDVFEELGEEARLVSLGLVAGSIEMLADAHEAAEQELRSTYEILELTGEKVALPAAAAELAEASLALGRAQEAAALTELSEQTGYDHDLLSQVAWRGTRAKLLAREGSIRRAEGLAREAVRLADRTDFLNVRADARMALAHVLELCGRRGEAGSVASRALDLYQAKGNLVCARKAGALLERLGQELP